MELGPQNHNNGDGLLGPNSIIVVYMDPLGKELDIRYHYREIIVMNYYRSLSRFLRNPFTIRVPFFLIFSFNKGTLNQKGQKGTTQEPSYNGSLNTRTQQVLARRGHTGIRPLFPHMVWGLGFRV